MQKPEKSCSANSKVRRNRNHSEQIKALAVENGEWISYEKYKNEMNTEDNTYKMNLKVHIHRTTAVICSGLLVFSGTGAFGVHTVNAADNDEREKYSLLPILKNYAETKKPEQKYDYQLKDFAKKEELRKFILELTWEETEGLPEKDVNILSTGKAREQAKARMQNLKREVKELLQDAEGTWSVYIKDLQNDVSFSVNNEEMYAASLIKLFVMEKCLENYDEIIVNYNENITEYKINITNDEGAEEFVNETAAEEKEAEKYIDTLLKAMIEVSDNESYNELVKWQNADRDFAEGAKEINKYLETRGYTDTGLYHSLHPAPSAQEWISMEQNHTSVEDCGLLLERIYDGECVSAEASEEMLQHLLNQQVVGKIPEGLPQDESVVCANKTGETDTDHHDAAIVFGPRTDYVLCVMSSEWTDGQVALQTIREISEIVYKALNEE